ncbi:WXG100 family type VII secretion target [Nocardioides sp. URHA0020]|uniref:WXG100 family type VII secretion target n=1 Tax=Nocardioides sp. URHA0020 TaxID=1380392 RepID=UPI00055F99FF|nr:WXG100 family type VII secretion target [Nocardioides sp. URHA0020]
MYAVDLDLLDETTSSMARCGDALDDLLDEVSRRVTALRTTWDGAAALAQDEAQSEWEDGFREMREALAAMRAAGRAAHGHYGDAVATNLRMWDQL